MGMKAKEMWEYMAELDYPKLERIKFIIVYRSKDFWLYLLKNVYKVYPFSHKHRWSYRFRCSICRKTLRDIDNEI